MLSAYAIYFFLNHAGDELVVSTYHTDDMLAVADASIGSFAEEKRSQVDASQTGKKLRYSGSHLPEVTMTMCSIIELPSIPTATKL